MTSGRPAIALAASPGAARSAATVSTFPLNVSGLAGQTTSSRLSLSMGLPASAPSLPSLSVSLRPIMPAAPVMSTCTSSAPEAAWRCLTHGVQFAQAYPLPSLPVEILRREPALEGSLARRPFAVEDGVIRRVAAAALRDHVLPERAFVNEAVA